MADKDKEKAKIDLGLLEEDDEFEEFPAEGMIKVKNSKLYEFRETQDDKQNFNIVYFLLTTLIVCL
jgi:hypothetical protein